MKNYGPGISRECILQQDPKPMTRGPHTRTYDYWLREEGEWHYMGQNQVTSLFSGRYWFCCSQCGEPWFKIEPLGETCRINFKSQIGPCCGGNGAIIPDYFVHLKNPRQGLHTWPRKVLLREFIRMSGQYLGEEHVSLEYSNLIVR